jgi:hypothetical protein
MKKELLLNFVILCLGFTNITPTHAAATPSFDPDTKSGDSHLFL